MPRRNGPTPAYAPAPPKVAGQRYLRWAGHPYL